LIDANIPVGRRFNYTRAMERLAARMIELSRASMEAEAQAQAASPTTGWKFYLYIWKFNPDQWKRVSVKKKE
jgi:hypothetical protein